MSIDSERRRSFDGVVDHYDAVRPGYPAELFDAVFAMLPPDPRVIEVGPGTGQATRDLLARGARVHAVELGPALAGRLRSNLTSGRLEVTVGDFEVARLPIADAVFAATAYHWISPDARVDRPAGLLRSGGVVAIVDLIQVESPDDHGFFAAAQPIYDRFGQGSSGRALPTRATVDPPIRAALAADDRFADVAVRRSDWNQTYSTADYLRLLRSYSGTQSMDPVDREDLLGAMGQLADRRFGGMVTRPLVATLTTARRG